MLSKQKKEELAKVFKIFDIDGNGTLNKEEVKKGYQMHYGKAISDEALDKMFRMVDIDNSGDINYSEFIIASMNEQEVCGYKFLETAFKMFDKDGSGTISPAEIKQVLGFGEAHLNPETIS